MKEKIDTVIKAVYLGRIICKNPEPAAAIDPR